MGKIESVRSEPILKALDEGLMPILSSTASDADGQCYNVNADTVAAQIAIALKARRLVYLSDVPGLLKDPEDPPPCSPASRASGRTSQGAKGDRKGMLPKVNSAVDALNAGVNRVHFIDGRLPHSILLEIFTDEGIGTEIVHD